MIYALSLRNAGLIAGGFLCLLGIIGLVMHKARATLGQFPRSRLAGVVILAIEFLIALPIGFFLAIRFVDEFLAVRALGIFALLAAEPLLEASFFRYETSRLVLTVLAYILIVLGLIWVTLPYKLRDQINWFSKSAAHWRSINAVSLVYGVALIALAFILY